MEYRKKGYSKKTLLELQKVAFEKNNINELSDYIPIDRINAIKTFKNAGFIETNNYKIDLVFGQTVKSKQLIITKEVIIIK